VGLHLAMLADRLDVGRLRQERTHDTPVTFGVQTEVVEGIGMTALAMMAKASAGTKVIAKRYSEVFWRHHPRGRLSNPVDTTSRIRSRR
jgi:hypothetical protein